MVQLSDHGSLLRARGGGAERVTPLELFFDLVYVFAVTQLSHRLLEDLGVRGALETLLLLVVVWSTWVGTAWITNWFDPTGSTQIGCRCA
jgi:low temperature requirement protein LtrA